MIEEVIKIVGESNVFVNNDTVKKYQKNVSGVTREIEGVVMPETTEEVLKIVQAANKHKVPLYPISTGRNWGLGSRLPVKNGGFIVDLRRMNKILYVNEKFGYAVIEPGVTQKILFEYLKKNNIPYMFNVIGSGVETSLIGNALDRGIGYFSSRAENIFALEVVCGNGKILKTGFSHYENSVSKYLYSYGVGPCFDGLFAQGNFGIVTKAALKLIPEPEFKGALMIRLKDSSFFPQLIDGLRELGKSGIINTAFHIGNKNRTKISMVPILYTYFRKTHGFSHEKALQLAETIFEKEMGSDWSTIGGIMGTRKSVKEAKRVAKKILKGIASVTIITKNLIEKAKKLLNALKIARNKRYLLDIIEPFFGYSQGIPSDSAINSVYFPVSDFEHFDEKNPDLSDSGLLYFLPIIPMDGKEVLNTLNLVNSTFEKYGFTPYITLNMIGYTALEGVINLAFKRSDKEQLQKAHRCMDELHEKAIKQGLIPYRVGIYHMDKIVDKNDVFWQTVAKLKTVFDPNNIIAPGRYNLI